MCGQPEGCSAGGFVFSGEVFERELAGISQHLIHGGIVVFVVAISAATGDNEVELRDGELMLCEEVGEQVSEAMCRWPVHHADAIDGGITCERGGICQGEEDGAFAGDGARRGIVIQVGRVYGMLSPVSYSTFYEFMFCGDFIEGAGEGLVYTIVEQHDAIEQGTFEGEAAMHEGVVVGGALLLEGDEAIDGVVGGLYKRCGVEGLFVVGADVVQETFGVLEASFSGAGDDGTRYAGVGILQAFDGGGEAHFEEAAHSAQAVAGDESFVVGFHALEHGGGGCLHGLFEDISLKRILGGDRSHSLYVTLTLHIC